MRVIGSRQKRVARVCPGCAMRSAQGMLFMSVGVECLFSIIKWDGNFSQ